MHQIKHTAKAVKECLNNNCFYPYIHFGGMGDGGRIIDAKTIKGVLYVRILSTGKFLTVNKTDIIVQK